jgi:hypothetical protein
MTAGLWTLLFATAAMYGLVRLFAAARPALLVSVGFAGLVALWVAAYFSGGGRSVRRAGRGWVVAAVAGGVSSVALGAGGRLDGRRVAVVVWIVAWLLGASVALGSDGRDLLRWRVAAGVVLGVPAAAAAVAMARIPVLGVVAGVALLAAPLAVADAAALRGQAA